MLVEELEELELDDDEEGVEELSEEELDGELVVG